MNDQVSIAREDPRAADARRMIAALDAFLKGLYAPEDNHLLTVDAMAVDEVTFLVARNRHGKALGCGALTPLDDGAGEIKRMWVEPEARGMGLGRVILMALEEAARTRAMPVVMLETGAKQPEALALFKAAGFTPRDAFASYCAGGCGLYFEKQLITATDEAEHFA